MIDAGKKLLSVSEKRGDGSARPPVVTGQSDEARRRHEPTRPVRGDNTGRRRTRNANAPMPPAVDNLDEDLEQ